MSRLLVEGNRKLAGEVLIQGAKNSILPILAATVLCSGKCILHNCPDILDVDFSLEILRYLGADVLKLNGDIIIDASIIKKFDIPEFLMKEMRSSIIFLGSMLGKLGCSEMFLPGGCELGPRPIDLHLKYLKLLGVSIVDDNGNIKCQVNKKMKGIKISFPFPSVGATENIILASVLCEGKTVINNAAREPEICDMVRFLNLCGAKIYGAGSSTIIVEGVKKLHGAEYFVMPDRIVATTFMAATAITHGEVLLKNVNHNHLKIVTDIFENCGCKLMIDNSKIYLKAPLKLNSFKKMITEPYPGFPTDAQAILMAASTRSLGTSIFKENVFPKRYSHVDELLKMGADIKLKSNVAIVHGVDKLNGASIKGKDLRGTAALIVAALGAEGISQIDGLKHLDRGYENIEEKLSSIGALIRRI